VLERGGRRAPIGRCSAGVFAARREPAIDFSPVPICRRHRTHRRSPARRAAETLLDAARCAFAPLPVAIDYGFFQKQNLERRTRQLQRFDDQLLEASATGKSDAGLAGRCAAQAAEQALTSRSRPAPWRLHARAVAVNSGVELDL